MTTEQGNGILKPECFPALENPVTEASNTCTEFDHLSAQCT